MLSKETFLSFLFLVRNFTTVVLVWRGWGCLVPTGLRGAAGGGLEGAWPLSGGGLGHREILPGGLADPDPLLAGCKVRGRAGRGLVRGRAGRGRHNTRQHYHS